MRKGKAGGWQNLAKRLLREVREGSRRKSKAGGWHGGKVLPLRGKTAPVTGPAGRT